MCNFRTWEDWETFATLAHLYKYKKKSKDPFRRSLSAWLRCRSRSPKAKPLFRALAPPVKRAPAPPIGCHKCSSLVLRLVRLRQLRCPSQWRRSRCRSHTKRALKIILKPVLPETTANSSVVHEMDHYIPAHVSQISQDHSTTDQTATLQII
jgi:hypothetical protein